MQILIRDLVNPGSGIWGIRDPNLCIPDLNFFRTGSRVKKILDP